ncbi:sporulation related protein [Geothermobacter ehrlichii]|uniref:Sporulation related protein n=1 Tax=Geothermobacter ehrlichii TaxID=213224 RepID=A0A5D3WH51_9BACT|nr:SPOR domain-containing protein [Geothermobacter ehrlichii]TYO95686.1 sporulation related protein [Geothermobacter ehrlichii]
MTAKAGTRTQRRMARRQAMLLFVAVLVVALVSFSLGVMVGRSGHRPAPRSAAAGKPLILPEAKPAPLEPPAVEHDEEKSAAAPVEEKLTFYDTLPRGEQPLGSGINLPKPSAKQPQPEQAATIAPSPQPAPAGKPEPVVQPARPAAPERQAEPAATSSTNESGYVLQVASFRDVKQAEALSRRLAGKGYDAFVRRVDLGGKGIWQRVYVGPYSDRPTAEKAAKKLKLKEKFSPLVRRQ